MGFDHERPQTKRGNRLGTSRMTIYIMNTISPISLYIKLDKLQSLKKDFTCINVFFLHLLIKSPIFPMYIQAVELCYKSLSSLSHILQHLFLFVFFSKRSFVQKKKELYANDEVPLSHKLPSYIIWMIK